jgi:hypothetical protein
MRQVIKLLEMQFYKSAGIDNDKKSEGVQSILLDEAQFKIMPVFGKFQVYYLYGASGSGKSYIARDLNCSFMNFHHFLSLSLSSTKKLYKNLISNSFISYINLLIL